jgi:hypothetical protein
MYPFPVPRYGDRVKAIPSASPSYPYFCHRARPHLFAHMSRYQARAVNFHFRVWGYATFVNEDKNHCHDIKISNNSMA